MDPENTIPLPPADRNNDVDNQPQAVTMYTETVVVHDWRYASFLERFAALVLDYIFTQPILFLIGALAYNINFLSHYRLIQLLVFSVYNIVSLSLYGTTIGKHVMKLKVISENNQPLTIGHLLIRETIGKFLSSILIGMGYTAMIFHPRKQTWHDRMAHTLVVKYPKQSIRKAILLYLGLFLVVLVLTLLISIIVIQPIID